jgi:hypothetical protein
MLADVKEFTGDVVIGNVMLESPAGTVTEPCVWATAGVSLASDTIIPPSGAGPFNLTVPVEFFPPATLVGNNVTAETADGFTVNGSCFTEAPLLAVIEIGLGFRTARVVMLKVALVSPAGTVTLGGTVATVVSLDVRFTVMPPAYAAAGSVTVPLTTVPLTAVVADKLNVDSTGNTVTVAMA